MADFGPTQLNAVTAELWDEKVEVARYANGVILNAVSNKSEIAKQKGDKINVSIDKKLQVVTVGSDGTFTPQNYILDSVQINLDQWESIPISILDQSAAQAFWTPASTYPTMAGKAWADRFDSQLASEHSNLTQNIVGVPASPDPANSGQAREALFKLADRNVPTDDGSCTFIFHPVSYWGGIMTEAQLTSANQGGSEKNLLKKQEVIPLLGISVKLSTNIKEVGSPAVKKNLLLHKSALAIAWSKTNSYEKVRQTANLVLADLLVTQNVYGWKTVRADHGVVINSSAAGAF